MPQIKQLPAGTTFISGADYITQEPAGDTVKLTGDQIIAGIAAAIADDTSFIAEIGDKIAALESVQGILSTAFLSDSTFLNYISAYVANNTDVHDIIATALEANTDFNDAIRDNILADSVFIEGIKTELLSDSAFIGGISSVLLSDSNFITSITNLVMAAIGGESLQIRDTKLYPVAVDSNVRNYFAMTNNGSDVYVSTNGGDIYKQTKMSGAFTAQSFTSRDYYGLACLGASLYASVGVGDIYKQTDGTGTLNALSQTSRAWRGMDDDGTNLYASVYNDAVGGDGGLYKQTAGAGDFVLYHAHEALIMDVLCADGDIYYCVEAGDIYKQTAGTGDFVAQGNTKNWASLSYANGDVYALAQNDGIYRQNDKIGEFTKLYNATTEEIRGSTAVGQYLYYALYGQVGLNRTPAPPKALEVYSTAETLTNQTFLGYPVYRKVINFGALPNNTAKSVAHGLTGSFTIFNRLMYATNKTNFLNLNEGVGTSDNLYTTEANVVFNTALNRSAFTTSYVTIEYIKAAL